MTERNVRREGFTEAQEQFLDEALGTGVFPTLENLALAVSTAQHVGVHDGYSWLEAADEIGEAEADQELQRSTPIWYHDRCSHEELWSSIEIEADTIKQALEVADVLP